jgi:hypothetical protein
LNCGGLSGIQQCVRQTIKGTRAVLSVSRSGWKKLPPQAMVYPGLDGGGGVGFGTGAFADDLVVIASHALSRA